MLHSERVENQMGQKDTKSSLGSSITHNTVVNIMDSV